MIAEFSDYVGVVFGSEYVEYLQDVGRLELQKNLDFVVEQLSMVRMR